jgi:hypothetical protein
MLNSNFRDDSNSRIRSPNRSHVTLPPATDIRTGRPAPASPDLRFAGLPDSPRPTEAGQGTWRRWFSGMFSAAPDTNEYDRLPLAALILRIEHCQPAQVPALAAALQAHAGVKPGTPRRSPDQVVALLRGPDWCAEIVAGRLDANSLVNAIGAMPDWQTRQALMTAIDLAFTQARPGRKVSHVHAQPTRPLRAAPGDDTLQAQIAEILATPFGQKTLARITKLFRKLGNSTQTEPVAMTLALHFDRLIDGRHLKQQMRLAFMPRLIQIMLSAGFIEGRHAVLARSAAARVTQYARMSGTHEPFTGGISHLANDQDLLCRLLDEPKQWPHFFGNSLHNFGVRSDAMTVKLLADLLDVTDRMEVNGFIRPLTADLLRRRLPDVVQASHERNRYLHHRPPSDPQLAGTLHAGVFDPAAMVQFWRGDDLLRLRNGLEKFQLRGSTEVDGANLIDDFGDVLIRLLRSPEKVSAVLAHLNRQLPA